MAEKMAAKVGSQNSNTPIITTEDLVFETSEVLRKYNVTVPSGRSMDRCFVAPLPWGGVSLKAKTFAKSPTDIILIGNGFISTDTVTITIFWF